MWLRPCEKLREVSRPRTPQTLPPTNFPSSVAPYCSCHDGGPNSEGPTPKGFFLWLSGRWWHLIYAGGFETPKRTSIDACFSSWVLQSNPPKIYNQLNTSSNPWLMTRGCLMLKGIFHNGEVPSNEWLPSKASQYPNPRGLLLKRVSS